ncbi:hypothetical protein H9659_13300 [Sporosarcina sp. Sa3CUA8]|uniref:Uncharacterized protein n=1 Tax=Sporosarcina gallistercoris TaxID=2762245 RepID=A0ABR8PMD0_9BACL|nr:hypothetical protein [Sporosarcina gallistercoris]
MSRYRQTSLRVGEISRGDGETKRNVGETTPDVGQSSIRVGESIHLLAGELALTKQAKRYQIIP